MRKYDVIVDGALLAVGTTYSITNITTILGVVVLALQILWIATKIIVRIVNHIKNGKDLSDLDDEVNDFIELVDSSANHIKKVEGETNGENTERK